MKDSKRRKEATVLIQATFRMYKQKCKWKKFKNGIIALQRLSRYVLKKANKLELEFQKKKKDAISPRQPGSGGCKVPGETGAPGGEEEGDGEEIQEDLQASSQQTEQLSSSRKRSGCRENTKLVEEEETSDN